MNTKIQFTPTKERLEQLYRTMTVQDIADFGGVTKQRISYLMNKLGVETIKTRKHKKHIRRRNNVRESG